MKYIFYVYKLISSEDPIKIYVNGSSDRKKIHKNSIFKNSFTKKIIKSYPVSNKDEEELKIRYWINKYKNYGYDVYSSLEIKKEEKCKLYVCLENVTMSDVVSLFGNKIISISKEKTNNVKKHITPKKIKPIVKKKEKKEIIVSGNYLDELKNVLNKRNNGKTKIKDLVKKRKTPKIKEIKLDSNMNFLDELKSKIKVIN